MKYVLLIYQGISPPLPGSDRWNALSKAEQAAIYADYGELTKAPGVTPGLPLGDIVMDTTHLAELDMTLA